jgi:hypothetical protein
VLHIYGKLYTDKVKIFSMLQEYNIKPTLSPAIYLSHPNKDYEQPPQIMKLAMPKPITLLSPPASGENVVSVTKPCKQEKQLLNPERLHVFHVNVDYATS